MWRQLDKQILDMSNRLIKQHETYAKYTHDENVRRSRRSTGAPEKLPVRRPEVWGFHPGFDPYLVRSRYKRIAHAVKHRLKSRDYSPMPPAGFNIPKSASEMRTVSTYQIADEVVSNITFNSLMKKNLPRLSGRAYAYRADRGAHDAVSYISREFKRHHRLFIAEYDFSKFFEKIDHDFLLNTLDSLEISRTLVEQHIIENFLASPAPQTHGYRTDLTLPKREMGIPQGTSLSLFLANVAASELDRSLERLGVGFVRYADDTLIWSSDYGLVSDAAGVLHEAAASIGSPINSEKSPGIRLLQTEDTQNAEFSDTKAVDYLGHSLGLRSIRMKESSILKIKNKINDLIYNNLLREPLAETQDLDRLHGTLDRDYIALIWQLRRYLYGPLSENDVRRYQKGNVPPMSFQGVMAFFPLVHDEENLTELDAWILNQIWLALRKRTKLLSTLSNELPEPHHFSKTDLISFQALSQSTNQLIDLRVPSVKKISSAIRLAVSTHGFSVLSNNTSHYHYLNQDHTAD